MSIWQSILLGLIQGVTEFLPISSSGHLILFQQIFNVQLEGNDMLFDTLLHLGTLVAVFIAFRKRICALIKSFFRSIPQLFKGQLKPSTADGNQRMIFFIILSVLPLFILVPFKDKIESIAYGSTLFVGIALLFNSVILLLCDRIVAGRKKAETMTVKDALIVGGVQAVAVLPGISRSGSTITAGVACGMKRKFAAEYSFVLSIPTILGSVVLNVLDVVKEGVFNTGDIPAYIIGMVVAAVSGFFSIKLLEILLKSKKFSVFSIYCAVVGIFAIVYFLLNK